ncbi:MAG: penicillin-insensitive murein endopeptidase [Deltaproteobacteria bacterium]|nr:penicillin-insensitive murein endopeptidase [Deltaproteobacteria bacterium]
MACAQAAEPTVPTVAAALAALPAPPPGGPSVSPRPAHGESKAPPAPAFDAPYLGHLAPDESLSIGTTRGGYVVGARRLEPGPGLALRDSAVTRGALWGTATFVEAIARAARHVAQRFPGSVLFVGDLGLEHGGAIPPHRSHASGRDVDLTFYVTDADGRPADGPAMTRVDAEGRVAGGGKRFDAARNWALVEALLRDPAIQIQWIFVAAHLEPLLLAAAAEAGAPPALVERAARVMQQPGDSSPHADHFHVRVYCTEPERLQGCLDAAPVHPWVDTHDDAVARWIEGLVPFLADPRGASGDEFRFAVERLVRANARAALPHLEPLAGHPDPATRALVVDAIDFLSGRRTPQAWARWRPEDVGD